MVYDDGTMKTTQENHTIISSARIYINGRRIWLFWAGTLATVLGVCSQISTFISAASLRYKMVGMPMGYLMLTGMAFIVVGIVLACLGLVPSVRTFRTDPSGGDHSEMSLGSGTLDNTALSAFHWKMLAVLSFALMIDAMKPATIGFIMPGVCAEYGISKEVGVLLPLAALTGIVLGSILWGYFGDYIGRRRSILLACLMFIGTSGCGAMPTFGWNVVMCFFMGASAGGLLPVVYALLVETVPARYRGGILVLVGGIGSVGGYLMAAVFAAVLEPHFGWRIMWFLGLPTGMLLVVLNRYIPESPRFLVSARRMDEAYGVVAKRRSVTNSGAAARSVHKDASGHRRHVQLSRLLDGNLSTITASLNCFAITWGLVSFGFIFWLPMILHLNGLGIHASNAILANSAIISFAGIPFASWLYYRWSARLTLVMFAMSMVSALVIFGWFEKSLMMDTNGLMAVLVVLLISTNCVGSMLLPYSSELYPSNVRSSGVGFVAGSGKLGGFVGLGLSTIVLMSGVAVFATAIAVPALIATTVLGYARLEEKRAGSKNGASTND